MCQVLKSLKNALYLKSNGPVVDVDLLGQEISSDRRLKIQHFCEFSLEIRSISSTLPEFLKYFNSYHWSLTRITKIKLLIISSNFFISSNRFYPLKNTSFPQKLKQKSDRPCIDCWTSCWRTRSWAMSCRLPSLRGWSPWAMPFCGRTTCRIEGDWVEWFTANSGLATRESVLQESWNLDTLVKLSN